MWVDLETDRINNLEFDRFVVLCRSIGKPLGNAPGIGAGRQKTAQYQDRVSPRPWFDACPVH
jgi:hypothetical protein